MLSAAAKQQAKLAMKAKARKQRLAVWTKRDEAEWRRLQNAAAVLIVVIDKREIIRPGRCRKMGIFRVL